MKQQRSIPTVTRSLSGVRPEIVLACCILSICGVTAYIGAVPTRICGHDNFFLLDNGWRIVSGQRPHMDFFSPWGPFTFLAVGTGLLLSHSSANAIGYGNAIFGLVIGFWSLGLSLNRISPVPRFLLVIYLTLLTVAPYPLGVSPLLSSHAMVYNRYGYALIGLLLIECFQLKNETGKGLDILYGVSTGAVVAITLFLKANYFVIALPLIAASFLLARPSVRKLSGLLIGFFIVALTMVAYLGFDIWTLLETLRMAAGARAQALSLSILGTKFRSQIPALLVVLAILFFQARQANCGPSSIRGRWVAAWVLVFASDSLLMFSNMQVDAMPLLGIFGALFASQLTATSRPDYEEYPRDRLSRFTIVALCAFLFAPQLILDSIGLIYGTYEKFYSSKTSVVARFTEPHLFGMVLYDNGGDVEANGSSYTNYVNDGVALLRKYCREDDRVLTMDMVNPFPYALQWKPPKGGIAAVAFNYTLSARFRPSFDSYFGNATVVMVPRRPALAHCYIDGFYRLFIPAMLDRYRLYAQSNLFRLYKRK